MLVPTLLEVGTRGAEAGAGSSPTIRGEIIWCQGYSEPGSGCDLAARADHARRSRTAHFVINGQKIWTSSAHYADMMFLLCRTEPDKPQARRPVLPAGADERRRASRCARCVTMTGRADFNETFFTDVRVPVDQIVMGRGDGWQVANVTLKYERLLLGDPNKLSAAASSAHPRADGAHRASTAAPHRHARNTATGCCGCRAR